MNKPDSNKPHEADPKTTKLILVTLTVILIAVIWLNLPPKSPQNDAEQPANNTNIGSSKLGVKNINTVTDVSGQNQVQSKEGLRQSLLQTVDEINRSREKALQSRITKVDSTINDKVSEHVNEAL